MGNVVDLLHFDDSTNIGKNEYGTAWTGNSTIALDRHKFGKGCLLNANYSHLDGPSIQFNDKMTVSFWAMATSTDAKLYYAYNNINNNNIPAYIILASDPGARNIYCAFSYNGTTYDFNTIVIPTITLNEWHHIALVVNSNVVYIFLDGVKTFEHTYTSNITIPYTAGAYDSIGSYRYFNTRPGTLYTDEFRISKTADWTDNFTPPVSPYSRFKKLYADMKDITKEVYSANGGTFTKVADDWTALTDAQKIALFKATNYETATPEQLATLGKFRIVTYSGNNSQPSCTVTALPKDQIVLPKELISTKAFENVDSITPTVTNNTTTAKVRFFLTNDLKTYYVYNSTTKAFDVIDATNSDTLLTSGMSVSDFTGIDTTALNTFISKNVSIGIGFVLSSTTISDLTTVDNLAMQVDMKGSWNHAVYGTDVTYGYTNNDVLTVTLVTANSFKINYQE